MESRGTELAEAIIEHDLECLSCGYNLRGLAHAVIHCPECGVECDVVRMIADRWTGPWQRAPGYSTLVAPVAWLVFTGLGLLVVLGFELGNRGSGWLTLLGAAIVMTGWIYHLNRARIVFDDGDRGVGLSLFAHVLLATYLAGSILAIVGLVRALIALPDWPLFILSLVMMMFGVGVFVVTRRCERYIGEQCIRRYLLQRAAAAPPARDLTCGESAPVSCPDER